MQEKTAVQAVVRFRRTYGTEPACAASAPGVGHIIGKHIDCTDGYALAAALSLSTLIAFAPRDDAAGFKG